MSEALPVLERLSRRATAQRRTWQIATGLSG